MGHVILVILHLVCLVWFLVGLLLTIPFHLLYAVMSSRRSEARRQQEASDREMAQMVRCAECKELVRWDAIRCKHCGAKLTPSQAPPQASSTDEGAKYIAIAVATLFAMVLLAKGCGAL